MAESSSTGTVFIQVVLAVLGIVGLYYLYKYLFSADIAPAILLSGKHNTLSIGGAGTTITPISTNQLPPLYTGGEFAVSTWFNVQSLKGSNASILRIGSATGSSDGIYDSLRIYLSGTSSQLMIRFTTSTDNRLVTTDNILTNLSTFDSVNSTTNRGVITQQLFTTTAGSNSTPATMPNSCDVLQIDMQRWIHLVVTVNGMSGDVYMDGKLVRSCILPNYVQFSKTPTVYLLDDGKGAAGAGGSFGGYISTTQMFGTALSPDIVYQMYMAGPEPITNFWEYITAFFNPTSAY